MIDESVTRNLVDALLPVVRVLVREALIAEQAPLIPLAKAAERIGYRDLPTARRVLAEHGIPVRKMGKSWFIPRESWDALSGVPRRWKDR